MTHAAGNGDKTTPTSIRQAGPTELEIKWKDGHRSLYQVAYLRRVCRCAACIDEWTGDQILNPETVPEDVKPVSIEPVGNYAIHIYSLTVCSAVTSSSTTMSVTPLWL